LLIGAIANKDKLTLLGCGSLPFILLASNPANAEPSALKYLVNIEFRAPNIESVNTSFAQEDPQNLIQDALDVNSDTVGDLAAAKFGCDCAGHRNQVVQRLQTGTLNLNQ